MASLAQRTTWVGSVQPLLVAAAIVSGSAASAQVAMETPSSDWASEPSPTPPGTAGGWMEEGAAETYAGDGMASSDAADCIPCPPGGPCATWRWRTEALALWRSSPRSRPLFSFIDDGDLAGTALDADQLVSDPLAAPRVSLFRDNNCGTILEASYLWAGNFTSQRSLPFDQDGYATSPPGIYGNDWGPATDTSLNSVDATLVANLQTAEINVRERFLRDMAQFLIGFRWLQWNENLQMRDSYEAATDSGTIFGKDKYQTACFNNLFGGQIGIDAMLAGSQTGFRIDGLIKAGVFYNDATQRSNYAYVDTSPYEFSTSGRVGSPDSVAFVGEVGMTAVIPVHCNLDLRVGYFGLWIEGLAQPTEQLSKQTLTEFDPRRGFLDTTGSVLVQGLSLGLEGRW